MRNVLILLVVGIFLTQGLHASESGDVSDYNSNVISYDGKDTSEIFYYGCTEPPSYAKPDKMDTIGDVPSKWDWRNAEYNGKTGNWCTLVKSQGSCGSCWAFSVLGMLESQIKISEGSPNADIDLSEQYLLSCPPDSGGCNGWSLYEALDFLELMGGAIPESCFPYMEDDSIPCDEKCENWWDYLIPITDFKYYKMCQIDEIKSTIVNHGPVSASFVVYEDFNDYSGGVYKHEYGELVSSHAIVIVGYDDEQNCWICKNSWSEYWGEEGYFRIAYGECNIDNNIYSVDFDEESLNWPPSANCGEMKSADVNEIINFDSSKSYDIDNDITTYFWDFGDGNTSTDPNPEHAYSKNGIYNVKLTVTDSAGFSSTDMATMFIDTWDVEDTFVYSLNANYDLTDFLIPLNMHGNIEFLKIEVVDKSSETYTLSISGKPKGEINIDISELIDLDFPLPLVLSGKLRRTEFVIEMVMEKAGFNISEINLELNSHLNAKLKPIPIPLIIPISIESSILLNPCFTLFCVSPEPGLEWDTPNFNFEVNGNIKLFYGLFSKSFELDDGSLGGFRFNCIGSERISTESGFYDTYIIEAFDGSLLLYYCPDICNIVKIESSNSSQDNFIDGELISLEESNTDIQ